LVRSPVSITRLELPAFLRELFKTIEDSVFGQAKISIFFQAARTFIFIGFCLGELLSRPACKSRLRKAKPGGLQRKISKSNRQNARAAEARRSMGFWVLQWVCSL
jgi:hypothetical protein